MTTKKLVIRAMYKSEITLKQPMLSYDQKSKDRPAWIEIKNLPSKTRFISLNYGHRQYYYMLYLMDGLYLPIDYTSDEMRQFYDKWSDQYDSYISGKANLNIEEGEFIVSLFDKYNKNKDIKILDLGAGTGLLSEILVKHGYKDITLVDISKKMLRRAEKKSSLNGLKFVNLDIKKLALGMKFDVACSLFSFVSSSYFKKNEMPEIFSVLKKHLKKNALFFLVGHLDYDELEKNFEILDSGEHEYPGAVKNRPFFISYFIGRKK